MIVDIADLRKLMQFCSFRQKIARKRWVGQGPTSSGFSTKRSGILSIEPDTLNFIVPVVTKRLTFAFMGATMASKGEAITNWLFLSVFFSLFRPQSVFGMSGGHP